MHLMSRFDDCAVDVQELLRRLAEQVVNAVMDAVATCVGRIVSQVFCGRGHVRAGRDMAGVQVLLGDEGTSSTTRAQAWNRRGGRLGAA